MVLLSLGSARWTYFYAGSFWLQFSVGAIVSTGVRRRRWWYGRVSGVSASTRHCHYLLVGRKDMVMAILFSLLPSVSTATEDPWTMIDVITIKQTIGQIVASNW